MFLDVFDLKYGRTSQGYFLTAVPGRSYDDKYININKTIEEFNNWQLKSQRSRKLQLALHDWAGIFLPTSAPLTANRWLLHVVCLLLFWGSRMKFLKMIKTSSIVLENWPIIKSKPFLVQHSFKNVMFYIRKKLHFNSMLTCCYSLVVTS